MAGMVIVGAGQAGGGAALALRERGYDGPITLVGQEPHAPYERPPLSKAAMVGVQEPVPAFVATAERLAELAVTFLPGALATGVDRRAQAVMLQDGTRIPYTKLLLATGAQARALTIEGGAHAMLLRSHSDAQALRAVLPPGAHVVVIGGGFIGLEIAASAIARGCRVTLLEAGPRVLMRGVPLPIAEHVAASHRAHGVTIQTGVALAAIRQAHDGISVVFQEGGSLACDRVIAGVGAVPEVTLAKACGLAIENGVRVDATLRTDDPAIFAAGDCCSYPSALFGRRLRLEAWRNAQAHGAHVAGSMLGAAEHFDAVPWFWSDQYDETLQVAGLPDAGTRMVQRGQDRLWFHLDASGTLVGASCIGPLSLSKDIRLAEMLIARAAKPDPAALAAPGTKLKSLLAT